LAMPSQGLEFYRTPKDKVNTYLRQNNRNRTVVIETIPGEIVQQDIHLPVAGE